MVIFLLAGLSQQVVTQRSRGWFAAESSARLDRLAFLLSGRLRTRANDLFQLKYFLERDAETPPAGEPVSGGFRALAEALMISRGGYAQIRILDPRGRETLRLDWRGGLDAAEPRIEETPPDRLQDKSSQPYFRETMAAAGDEAVFSPVDLNQENGKVEMPPRPVVRLSTRIQDRSGAPIGVLVLNCDGTGLLRELREGQENQQSLYLLNTDGYWLVGPKAEMEWGFALPGEERRPLEQTDPAFWREIAGKQAGWFSRDGDLFCHRLIDPAGSPAVYPVLRIPVKQAGRVRGILLEKTPAAVLWKSVKSDVTAIWTVAVAALLTAVPGAWLLASSGFRRRLALHELNHSRAELSQVLASSPNGIVAVTAKRDEARRIVDFRIRFGNQAAARLTGQSPEAMAGQLMRRDFPGIMSAENFRRCGAVVESGEPAEFESHFEVFGVERWFRTQAARLDDGAVVSFADLTERKRAEEKLRHSEALLGMAARMSKMGGWEFDLATDRMTWSEEVYRIHEVPRDFVPETETALSFYPEPSRTTVTKTFGSCVKEGSPFDLEVEFLTAKGRRLWVRTIGEAEWREGRIHRINGTLQDITDQRDAALALLRTKEKAEMANRAKGEFLAMMSHEIRTPMNAVLGFAGLLADSPLDARQSDYLKTITTSGNALLRIINDILDFSRIESGHLNLEETVFSPRELVGGIHTLLLPRAQEGGIALELDIDPTLPPLISGDAGRLRQILVNLTGNAVKFTSSGCVTVGVRAGPPQNPGDDIRLEFSVRDTGPGIAPEDVARVFEPFTQADSTIARRYGGTGLGLSISKSLVGLMGGLLEVKSRFGEGSTFGFSLPFRVAEAGKSVSDPLAATALDASFATRHPLKILVADDDQINLKLSRMLLEKLGYRPRVAANGMDAVDLYWAEKSDCILMDMQMPVMSGPEATRRIRAGERENDVGAHVFISALTANVLPAERVLCEDAGMDDFLSKPLRLDALAALLARAHASRRPETVKAGPRETR